MWKERFGFQAVFLLVAVLLVGQSGLCFGDSASSLLVSGVAPPAIYPVNTWQGRSGVVVRVLDRMDSHITLLTLPVGGVGHYRSLSVRATACLQRPVTLPPDIAAHLVLEDSLAPDHAVFDGWFLAKEPALGGYVSPLYSVSVVECHGDMVAPQVGSLSQTQVPGIALFTMPHVKADSPSLSGGRQTVMQTKSSSSGGVVPSGLSSGHQRMMPLLSSPVPMSSDRLQAHAAHGGE